MTNLPRRRAAALLGSTFACVFFAFAAGSGCGGTPETGDQAAPLPPDYKAKQDAIAKGFYESTKGKAGGAVAPPPPASP